MKTEYAPLDISSYLKSDEDIAEYITAAADEGDDVFIAAVAHAAKARGMTRVAKEARLGREGLYKTLKPGARPRFDRIHAVLGAVGMRMVIEPAHRRQERHQDTPEAQACL
jgi:probable addiction module antidote protein